MVVNTDGINTYIHICRLKTLNEHFSENHNYHWSVLSSHIKFRCACVRNSSPPNGLIDFDELFLYLWSHLECS